MSTSGGSGLPEPENPTGFGTFFQTRTYPNPKISRIPLPESTRTRNNWEISNPTRPEPEFQTRGYPTGLETLEMSQKPWKIVPKNLRNSPFLCSLCNMDVHARPLSHSYLMKSCRNCHNLVPNWYFWDFKWKNSKNLQHFMNPKARKPEVLKPELEM